MKKFLTLFSLVTGSFIFSNPSPAIGQIADKLRFRQITSNDGLSQNYVSCLLQDYRGFMWIGTKDGLNRYDGYTFTIYRNNPFNTASLSSNYITSLYEDTYHHLWVGTDNGGLNLFDRKHDRFLVIDYPVDSAHKYKTTTTAITSGPGHHLWIGNNAGEVFEIDFPLQKADSLLKGKGAPIQVKKIFSENAGGGINSLYASGNILWIGTAGGLRQLDMMDPNRNLKSLQRPTSVVYLPGKDDLKRGRNKKTIPAVYKKFTPLHSSIWDIISDSSGNLWMASNYALYKYDRKRNCYYAFVSTLDTSLSSIRESTMIRSLTIRKSPGQKQIWAGSFKGLAILDMNDSTFTYYDQKKIIHEKDKLFDATVCVCFDRSGMFWLGTNGDGIRTFSPEITLFNKLNLPVVNQPELTLDQLSVRSFVKTLGTGNAKNNLWIGTNIGLYKMNDSSNIAEKINPFFRNYFILSDVIYALAADSAGNLFIGDDFGIIKYNTVNKLEWWDPYKNFKQTFGTRVQDIFIDHAENLWIATNYSLDRMLPAKDSFAHYWYRSFKDINESSDPTYPVICEDKKYKLWLGTRVGLFYFDPVTEKFIAHYQHNDSDLYSISSNWVTAIVPDHDHPRKYLWISTAGGGLNLLDLKTKKFTHFTEKDGLSNNNIYGLLADSSGRLWMSTNMGISRYDPAHHTFATYNVSNNLQSNEFNFGAFYKSPSGEMFFGGIKGFNYFNPRKIKASQYKAPLWITDFHLLGNRPGQSGYIPKNINDTDKITLPYKLNNFTITLSALDFSAPEKNEYAYRIKNQSDEWIPLGTNRNITFTNMTPGKYIFQAKATNSTGRWSPKITQLTIAINPPWWRTWWAYLIYVLILIGLIFFFRKRELNRVRLQLEAGKLKELDHLKSRFFANISHEFRTPLTLLIGPLEDLMNGGDEKAFKEIVPEMHRNSKRLLQLINQLLDLSRLDAGKYQINTEQENIIPFVKQIVHSFSSMAQTRDIRLETYVDPHLRDNLIQKKVTFYFDDDVIEKILTNLLSNAFKFTSNGGHIMVTLCLSEKEPDFLELRVEDNGEGIRANQLPYIFDRFYQAGSTQPGSGIGLALLKDLVELHGGKIRVSSEEGKGATFICLLPFNKKVISARKPVADKKEIISPVIETGDEENILAKENDQDSKPVILLVEDHQDVRKYIRSHLKDQYTILEAQNGKQGLEMATKNIPDLVISDVMMPVRSEHPDGPEMDGFELCAALKTDNRTSHVPVILLTARAEDKDKMTGLETGADAYLIKPFNSKELLIRVKNLISLRNKMRTKFSNKLIVKPAEIALTSLDREFMQKLLKTVEAHMDDANFSVEALGKEVNMSVSQINRKLKALINQTALRFIRSVRLARAMELLKNDTGTIAEIAFKTGFETPSYFTKMFKAEFGCLPSEKEKFPK